MTIKTFGDLVEVLHLDFIVEIVIALFRVVLIFVVIGVGIFAAFSVMMGILMTVVSLVVWVGSLFGFG